MSDESKPSCFHCVDHTIVSMGLVTDPEGELRKRLELGLGNHLDSLLVVRTLYFQKRWVTEENSWWTTWNWAVV